MKWLLGIAIILCTLMIFLNVPRGTSQESSDSLRTPGIQAKSISHLAATEDRSLDGRQVAPGEKSSALEVPTDASVAALNPLDSAMEETLLGYFDANRLLEEASKYLDEPLSTAVDMEHWDQTAFAFALGKEAHLAIQRETFEYDGKEYKGYTLRIEKKPPIDPWFLEGLPREDSRIDVSITMDADRNLLDLSILVDFQIDLSRGRDFGMDLYHGIYTQGATYDWRVGAKPTCRLLGIKNGNPQQPYEFEGPSQLQGELNIRRDLLELFKEKMVALIQKVENK